MEALAIASFGSDGILLATVGIFSLQTRQMARQSRATETAILSSVHQSITDNMLEIDRIFIDHPEFRPFFYENTPLPSEPIQRNQLISVAELFIDFVENHLLQSPHLPAGVLAGWRTYFLKTMKNSPALREYWHNCGVWYAKETQRLFSAYPFAPSDEEGLRPASETEPQQS